MDRSVRVRKTRGQRRGATRRRDLLSPVYFCTFFLPHSTPHTSSHCPRRLHALYSRPFVIFIFYFFFCSIIYLAALGETARRDLRRFHATSRVSSGLRSNDCRANILRRIFSFFIMLTARGLVGTMAPKCRFQMVLLKHKCL